VQCQTKFVASLEHSSLSRCIDLTSGTVHLLANRVLTLSCFLIWSALGGKLRHDDVNLDLSNAWRFCTFLPSPSSSLSLSTGAVETNSVINAICIFKRSLCWFTHGRLYMFHHIVVCQIAPALLT